MAEEEVTISAKNLLDELTRIAPLVNQVNEGFAATAALLDNHGPLSKNINAIFRQVGQVNDTIQDLAGGKTSVGAFDRLARRISWLSARLHFLQAQAAETTPPAPGERVPPTEARRLLRSAVQTALRHSQQALPEVQRAMQRVAKSIDRQTTVSVPGELSKIRAAVKDSAVEARLAREGYGAMSHMTPARQRFQDQYAPLIDSIKTLTGILRPVVRRTFAAAYAAQKTPTLRLPPTEIPPITPRRLEHYQAQLQAQRQQQAVVPDNRYTRLVESTMRELRQAVRPGLTPETTVAFREVFRELRDLRQETGSPFIDARGPMVRSRQLQRMMVNLDRLISGVGVEKLSQQFARQMARAMPLTTVEPRPQPQIQLIPRVGRETTGHPAFLEYLRRTGGELGRPVQMQVDWDDPAVQMFMRPERKPITHYDAQGKLHTPLRAGGPTGRVIVPPPRLSAKTAEHDRAFFGADWGRVHSSLTATEMLEGYSGDPEKPIQHRPKQRFESYAFGSADSRRIQEQIYHNIVKHGIHAAFEELIAGVLDARPPTFGQIHPRTGGQYFGKGRWGPPALPIIRGSEVGYERAIRGREQPGVLYAGRGPAGEHLQTPDIPAFAPGWLGNPFPLSQFSREESIGRYGQALTQKLSDPAFLRSFAIIPQIYHAVSCFCAAAEQCHTDIIRQKLTAGQAFRPTTWQPGRLIIPDNALETLVDFQRARAALLQGIAPDALLGESARTTRLAKAAQHMPQGYLTHDPQAQRPPMRDIIQPHLRPGSQTTTAELYNLVEAYDYTKTGFRKFIRDRLAHAADMLKHPSRAVGQFIRGELGAFGDLGGHIPDKWGRDPIRSQPLPPDVLKTMVEGTERVLGRQAAHRILTEQWQLYLQQSEMYTTQAYQQALGAVPSVESLSKLHSIVQTQVPTPRATGSVGHMRPATHEELDQILGPPGPEHTVIIDIETTGLSKSARIVELAAQKFETSTGRLVASYQTLVNPETGIPAAATAVHKITDAMVANQPALQQIGPDFVAFLGDPRTTTLAGHNIKKYDLPVISRDFQRVGHEFPRNFKAIADTLEVAAEHLPPRAPKSQAALAARYGLPAQTHRAMGDVQQLVNILKAMGAFPPQPPGHRQREFDFSHQRQPPRLPPPPAPPGRPPPPPPPPPPPGSRPPWDENWQDASWSYKSWGDRLRGWGRGAKSWWQQRHQRPQISDAEALQRYQRDMVEGRYQAQVKQARSHVKRGGGPIAPTKGQTGPWTGMIGYMGMHLVVGQYYRLMSAMSQSIEKAAQFQISLAEIQTISQQASDMGIGPLADEITQLSRKWGQRPQQTAEAVYMAISNQLHALPEFHTAIPGSGQSWLRARGFIDDAAQFGRAAATPIDESVEAIASVLNAYRMGPGAATQVGAEMFRAIELGRIRGSQMRNILGRVMPLASELGVDQTEVLAGIAHTTIQGMKPEESLTLLGNTMLRVLKPTRELQEELDRLGIMSTSLAVRGRGLQGFLEHVTEHSGTAAEQLGHMFGRIRAIRGVVALAGQSADRYREILRKIQEVTPEDLQAAAAKVTAVPGIDYEVMQSRLEAHWTNVMGPQLMQYYLGTMETLGPENVISGGVGLATAGLAAAGIGGAAKLKQAIAGLIETTIGKFGGTGAALAAGTVAPWVTKAALVGGAIYGGTKLWQRTDASPAVVQQQNEQARQQYEFERSQTQITAAVQVRDWSEQYREIARAATEAFEIIGRAYHRDMQNAQTWASATEAVFSRNIQSRISMIQGLIGQLQTMQRNADQSLVDLRNQIADVRNAVGDAIFDRSIRDTRPEWQGPAYYRRAHQYMGAAEQTTDENRQRQLADKALQLATRGYSLGGSEGPLYDVRDRHIALLDQQRIQEERLKQQAAAAERQNQTALRTIEMAYAELQRLSLLPATEKGTPEFAERAERRGELARQIDEALQQIIIPDAAALRDLIAMRQALSDIQAPFIDPVTQTAGTLEEAMNNFAADLYIRMTDVSNSIAAAFQPLIDKINQMNEMMGVKPFDTDPLGLAPRLAQAENERLGRLEEMIKQWPDAATMVNDLRYQEQQLQNEIDAFLRAAQEARTFGVPAPRGLPLPPGVEPFEGVPIRGITRVRRPLAPSPSRVHPGMIAPETEPPWVMQPDAWDEYIAALRRRKEELDALGFFRRSPRDAEERGLIGDVLRWQDDPDTQAYVDRIRGMYEAAREARDAAFSGDLDAFKKATDDFNRLQFTPEETKRGFFSPDRNVAPALAEAAENMMRLSQAAAHLELNVEAAALKYAEFTERLSEMHQESLQQGRDVEQVLPDTSPQTLDERREEAFRQMQQRLDNYTDNFGSTLNEQTTPSLTDMGKAAQEAAAALRGIVAVEQTAATMPQIAPETFFTTFTEPSQPPTTTSTPSQPPAIISTPTQPPTSLPRPIQMRGGNIWQPRAPQPPSPYSQIPFGEHPADATYQECPYGVPESRWMRDDRPRFPSQREAHRRKWEEANPDAIPLDGSGAVPLDAITQPMRDLGQAATETAQNLRNMEPQEFDIIPGLHGMGDAAGYVTEKFHEIDLTRFTETVSNDVIPPLHAVAHSASIAAAALQNVGTPGAAQGGLIPRYAAGGDVVNARLTPGEFVMNPRATAQWYPAIKTMNSMTQPRFAQGGDVTNIGDVIVNINSAGASQLNGRQIAQAVRRELRQKTARL